MTGDSGGIREWRYGRRESERPGRGCVWGNTTTLKLMETTYENGRRDGFRENKFCGLGGGCEGVRFFV